MDIKIRPEEKAALEIFLDGKMHRGQEIVAIVGFGNSFGILQSLVQLGLLETLEDLTDNYDRTRLGFWYAPSRRGRQVLSELFP